MDLLSIAKDNQSALIGGGIGLATGAILGAATTAAVLGSSSGTKKRKSSSKKKSSSKRRSKKRNKRKYYPESRGKKFSRRKIRTTKTGQPYIILASGKARFIKKSSARRARRIKGGRY